MHTPLPVFIRTNVLSHQVRAELPTLHQAAIFRDIAPDVLEQLVTLAYRVEGKSGQELAGEWDAQDSVFVLVNGGIRVLLRSPEGRELTLSRRVPVEAFELEASDDDLSGVVAAEASMDKTVVYVFGWPHLLEMLAFPLGAAWSLANLLRDGLMQDRRLITELAFYNIRRRLAHKLAVLAQRDANHIVRLSREQLASEIATRPEAVSRALRHFLDEGLIHYQKHERAIKILNVDALASF